MAPTQEAKRLRKGAGKGQARCQHDYAVLHYYGRDGVKKDLTTAAEWFRVSSTQGYAPAQMKLAGMLFSGEGVERDAEQAVAWLRKAASQVPEEGDGTELHRKAVVSSRRLLAERYLSDDCVVQDFVLAAEWLQKAADAGCPDSSFDLGELYFDGKGVEQNYARAVAAYRRAAGDEREEGGHAMAQVNLGHCYLHGHGVEEDNIMARAWYKKAALGGDSLGMFNAAVACKIGEDGEEDFEFALKMFHKLAIDEDCGLQGEAQNHLGRMYLRGEGVARDDTQAAEWFVKAAASGSIEGQVSLAVCHLNGWGVERDLFEAGRLFLGPAQNGNIHAQWELGEIFRKGELYCGRKMEMARKYIKLAAAQGCTESSECSDCSGCFAVSRLAEMRRDKLRCLRCGAERTHHKCAMCRDARYCSNECSVAHWRHGKGFDSTLGGTEEPHRETCARTHSRFSTSPAGD